MTRILLLFALLAACVDDAPVEQSTQEVGLSCANCEWCTFDSFPPFRVRCQFAGFCCGPEFPDLTCQETYDAR